MAADKLVSVCLVPNRHLWSKQLTEIALQICAEIDKWTVRLFIFQYIDIRGTCCRVYDLSYQLHFESHAIKCSTNQAVHRITSCMPK